MHVDFYSVPKVGRTMLTITEFLPDLADLLPETQAILVSANLVVHDAVIGVNLAGSRGLAGNCRPGLGR